MKATSVGTPERMDSTQPCSAATWASDAMSSTAAGPVMQVNHFFSTMSSPGPFSSVWNRCVCVLTMPGMRIWPVASITSAPG